MKACRKCGAEFTPSRADTTVNCPDCRRRPASAASDERYFMLALEAKTAAYAARKAGDKAAERAALDDLLRFRELLTDHRGMV